MSAFRVWGALGLVCGTGLALAAGDSPALMGTIAAAVVFVSLALVAVRVVLTGTETLVFYHQQLAGLAAAGVIAAAAGAPVLVSLDATALGLGLFNAFGRIGCLQAGCCHGRPARRGVVYAHDHLYAGIPLVPVQAFESAWALLVTAAGAAMLFAGAAPGTAFAWYLCAYSAGRFALELLRGDTGRRYRWGLSQPQRLALGCAAAVLVAELVGVLPVSAASLVACAALAALSIGVRRRPPLHPARVRELVELVRRAGSGVRMSGGISVSAGPLPGGRRSLTLSGAVDRRVLRLVAALIGKPVVLRGPTGAYHLVVEEGPDELEEAVDLLDVRQVPGAVDHLEPRAVDQLRPAVAVGERDEAVV